MAVSIVRLGSPRSAHEGLRIGTVRRPPRGVPKAEFASRDYYDVWLPNLAPSAPLMAEGRAAVSAAEWQHFASAYRKEMNAPEAAHVISTLAALSHTSAFSVGCYCEDEAHCHRSILRQLLLESGADVAGAV
ncbi:DUF488 domain-containing protein [Massilia sp. CF038]|uniref:DUF488 domain-containing protein n=1 Tax=Massilia sp. CF038 TaxID=1881045 RepID=UPI000914A5BA|nr:DUF488 family protein [Massilia sp. CF038]SHH16117.1 Uncharacterized conserved protein YeaO, DUF488 family [Massilia sp. CF038]